MAQGAKATYTTCLSLSQNPGSLPPHPYEGTVGRGGVALDDNNSRALGASEDAQKVPLNSWELLAHAGPPHLGDLAPSHLQGSGEGSLSLPQLGDLRGLFSFPGSQVPLHLGPG